MAASSLPNPKNTKNMIRNTNKKHIVYLMLLFLLVSCHNYGPYLITNNKSHHSIFSIISFNDNMSSSSYYYEYQEGYVKRENDFPFIFKEIESNSQYENHDTPLYWDNFFKLSKDNKIRLFIISKDSVDKYGWKQIFKRQIFNKKIELSKENLEKTDWKVTYE